jgi:hypothetical protein
MAAQTSHTHPQRVDRRRFLVSATVVCTGVVAPVEQSDAAGAAVVRVGPPERPRTDIEAWNVGLISARRPELTPAVASAQGRNRGGRGLAKVRCGTDPWDTASRYICCGTVCLWRVAVQDEAVDSLKRVRHRQEGKMRPSGSGGRGRRRRWWS